jgi:hypothetical protein
VRKVTQLSRATHALLDPDASELRLVRAGAERLELPFQLCECARQLLPARGMRGRLQLPAQLRVRQPERLGAPQLLGVLVGLPVRAAGTFFLALVHALLNPVLGVD